ncbi:RusA family crossover junction endodeoxyribonuclease [Gayadomonas joobiniege]|uniref:RusA family crossover junction endodeoxyribonuclease n=1 Tax=Gayadomonas joobiniege TaxID=1234606 RepID=UPI0012DD4B22|nr:RusA family crossover junction endodeoxyribonuclease [Gayadomonas joobiniege]
MTQRDRWAKRPAVLRYFAFKDECRLHNVQLPLSGSHVVFILPMSTSWSKKKKADMNGQPHTQKPDVDNLFKALADAVYDDDSKLWNFQASKFWGNSGRIIITKSQPQNFDEIINASI